MRKTSLFNLVLMCFFALMLNSCKNSSDEKLEDLEELMPQSKRNYSKDTTTIKTDTFLDSIQSGFSSLLKSYVDSSTHELLERSFYVDRFGPKESYKIQTITDSSSSILACWTFDDSIKTQNAFYNWLDCFGSNCKEMKVGKRVLIRENSGEIWIKDTLMIFWQSENSSLPIYQKDLIENFMPDTLKFHLKWKKNSSTQWLAPKNQ